MQSAANAREPAPTPANLGKSALHCALEGRLINCAMDLLAARADASKEAKDGKTPLQLAFRHSSCWTNEDLMQALLQNKADPNKKFTEESGGHLPLHLVISRVNDSPIVGLLLTAKANVDAADKSGMPPLHYAIKQSNVPCAELLIQSKADVNLSDNEGSFPLFLSAQNGMESVMKKLIEANADVNQVVVTVPPIKKLKVGKDFH
eukprot:TRINITY_DN50415_c0_g1_i1.p1 TRINITY_DN50415_c0_g1~~TRINITY_DN50415_c0_g1_i1.p1  ORF type:complete len:205 (-),score=24.23 TRINITY_DN50415_c0_g1_i1:1035-1649(-)